MSEIARASVLAPSTRRRATGVQASGAALERFGELLGSSRPMRALYDEIRRVAVGDATVLIIGDSGTGKELVARSLHAESPRRDAPFVAVNCGAIPASLLEAELFGHEKGSFTGAHQQHAGYFERASGGTLFLDEVTEMRADMQSRLLRVLETGRFYRVGGATQVAVNLRIVAATNQDPREAVQRGEFRDDLFYRLSVFPIHVPTLRDRGEDVVALAHHFLSDLNRRHGTAKRFSRTALEVLATHAWPGNVRELRNKVQRGYILADDVVEITDAAAQPVRRAVSRAGRVDVWVGTALADAQRELILGTLAHFGGNKPKAAEALGVSLKTLYNRLDQYVPVKRPTDAGAPHEAVAPQGRAS